MDELRRALKQYYYKPALALFRAVELQAIEEMSPSFEPPVLDLGCGDGVFMSMLGREPIAAGIDISETAVATAGANGTYGEVRVGTAAALPFADARFKTVFSNCVLEHIPEIDKVLSEVNRVLLPGGKLVFTVPSQYFDEFLFGYRFYKKMGLGRRAERYPLKVDRRIKQIHKEGPEWWADKLSHAGLEMLESRYYLPEPALGCWDILNVQPLRVLSLARFAPRPAKTLLAALENSLLKKPVAAWSEPQAGPGAGLIVLARKKN